LTSGRFNLWQQGGADLEMTFNSMLDHLLRGEFDVDPSIISKEGFYHDGRTFAYWGIFFALLRLPLLLFPGGLDMDVTRLSCLLAVCCGVYMKLLTVNLVFANLEIPGRERAVPHTLIFRALVLSILFSGPQIEFLSSTLYQEVCLWSGSLAAIFVYCAVKGVLSIHFGLFLLCCMAVTAGLALLARVSMGIGLYSALGLLLITIVVLESMDIAGGSKEKAWPVRFLSHVLSGRVMLPLVILLAFALLTGVVNFYRWGNPLVFANYNFHLVNQFSPDRLRRAEIHGLFNLSRVPFGLLYYFFPIWVLHRQDGHLLFEEHQRRLIDVAELPPSSFFLTDPLLVLFFGILCSLLLRRRLTSGINRYYATALLAGLAIPGLAILSAIFMSFRYRIEFYPLLEFGAFLGCFLFCKAYSGDLPLARLRPLCIAGTVLGIGASHLVLLLYKVSPFGLSTGLLRPGLILFYAHRLAPFYEQLLRNLR
jgi:hypothetical protein